jgi:hypothetical protein
MSRAKVTATVDIDEVNGEYLSVGEGKELVVESHWNRNGWDGLVVLKIPGLKGTISVHADEMIQAIERCHNLK